MDLVVFGRAAVDLYGEELGADLDQADRFHKSVGGAAANAAIAAARLGARVALLTRVGADPFGSYVARVLEEEGVSTAWVQRDPQRLTGLVVLGIAGPEHFPHLFYRNECADMAFELLPAHRTAVESARGLLLTGTHASTQETERASQQLARWARGAGRRVALDIDYRPALWGEAPLAHGDARAGRGSGRAGNTLRRLVPLCDVVVGTEDEIRVVGAREDAREAADTILGLGAHEVVVKEGARGAWSTTAEGHEARVDGLGVSVMNALGAGDAFVAAWLTAWLEGHPPATRLEWGNGAGALVVTRHACAPAMPTRDELMAYISSGSVATADRAHRQVRPQRLGSVLLLALDHRAYFEELAARCGRTGGDIEHVKGLVLEGGRAAFRARDLSPGSTGFIIDDEYGRSLFKDVEGRRLFRPIEDGRSEGLDFIGGTAPALTLRTWPRHHGVKCKVCLHPDDPAADRQQRLSRLKELGQACTALERPLLLEVLPRRAEAEDLDAVPALLADCYDQGIQPDLWKLPPPSTGSQWDTICRLIEDRDPACDGVVLLGNGTPAGELAQRIQMAKGRRLFRGFAFGRTVFGAAVEDWMRGAVSDAEVVADVARRWDQLLGMADPNV